MSVVFQTHPDATRSVFCLALVMGLHLGALSAFSADQAPSSTLSGPAHDVVSATITAMTWISEQQTNTEQAGPMNLPQATEPSRERALVASPSATHHSLSGSTLEPTDAPQQETVVSHDSPNPTRVQDAIRWIREPKFAEPPKPPVYPSLARKRGQQGTVWIDVVLDAEGMPAEQLIFKSSGISLLDQAALAAVSEWRFRPYEEDGQTFQSRIRIPIEFSLN